MVLGTGWKAYVSKDNETYTECGTFTISSITYITYQMTKFTTPCEAVGRYVRVVEGYQRHRDGRPRRNIFEVAVLGHLYVGEM